MYHVCFYCLVMLYFPDVFSSVIVICVQLRFWGFFCMFVYLLFGFFIYFIGEKLG